MRVFKPTYIVDGKRCTSPRWHVAFRDNRDTRRRVTAFTDKAQSEELGRKIVKLVATVGVGERPDVQLVKWIEALPPSIRDRLASFGLLNERLASASRPLTEHLDDFKAALLAKGGTDRHAVLVTARAHKVVDGCKFKYWADVSPSRVETYLKRLRDGSTDKRGVSRQTSNFYMQAIKQFCRWAVQDGRLSESPVAHRTALNVSTDRRHDRRAFVRRRTTVALDGHARRRGSTWASYAAHGRQADVVHDRPGANGLVFAGGRDRAALKRASQSHADVIRPGWR